MDDDYARKLRNWLRAEPGATPSGTSEEREWLREIPEPATEEQADTPDRWTVRGQLPQTPADDEWVCPVIELPVPRSSRENGCRISGIELRWSPPARVDGRAEAPGASRISDPKNAARGKALDVGRVSDAEARSRWNHPTNADGRGEALDVGRVSDAEARSRWNHPTNANRRTEAPDVSRRNHSTNADRTAEPPPSATSEAEARSRWNHPTNWHRRRRAAEDQRRDLPGSH
ncbi:hypothetical protein [Amycolatopsis sp. NPDC051716]|uniref:hypothetical protein n=1 Tax=Amycolatopsis sp. NPDC051716 TaxID=3155804 RepID=UPI003418728D